MERKRARLTKSGVPVVAGTLVLSVGAAIIAPTVKVARDWSKGVFVAEGIPLPNPKTKPLDIPGTTWGTANTLSSGSGVFVGARLAYAVTEPLAGAVTAQVSELFECIRPTTDDVPVTILDIRDSARTT